MSKFSWSTVEGLATSALAFGKKNAPGLMTGGGILLGWAAVYIFWKQGKKAEDTIRKKEAELQSEVDVSDIPEDDGLALMDAMRARSELPKKDKVLIYLQYCWMALALGVASTGLVVGAQKISMDRLAEMYILTKFLEDKNENQEKLVEKLKKKAGLKDNTKEMNKMLDEVVNEKYPDEVIDDILIDGDLPGEGDVVVIDETSGHRWRTTAVEFRQGVDQFNSQLHKKLEKAWSKRKIADPFYAESDVPFDLDDDDQPLIYNNEDEYGELYSSGTVGLLLQFLGDPVTVKDYDNFRLGELLEIRCYGRKDPVRISDTEVFKFKKHGEQEIIFVNYEKLVHAAGELMERSPL